LMVLYTACLRYGVPEGLGRSYVLGDGWSCT
jgi:hypothetical protein